MKVTGHYNARAYEVREDGETVYRAGNSPLESQRYLPPSQGVGLATMREYCGRTTHEHAEDTGSSVGGVYFEAVSEMLGDEVAAWLYPYDPDTEAGMDRLLTW